MVTGLKCGRVGVAVAQIVWSPNVSIAARQLVHMESIGNLHAVLQIAR